MKSFDSSSGEETWITPRWIIEGLGKFDLDPCSADDMPHRTATKMVSKQQNGLLIDWGNDRVWLNPPYGKKIGLFLEKMVNGIALLPCRTDTNWFHRLVLPRVRGIFFIKGRVRFINKHGVEGKSPAFASMLCAYSDNDVSHISKSGIGGGWLFKADTLSIPYR